MAIPLTQYLRPNGKKKPVSVEMPEEIEKKANDLLDKGYYFDAEVLTTGIVSFTCEKGEELLAIELTPNGPEVLDAIEKLVNTAHEQIQGNE